MTHLLLVVGTSTNCCNLPRKFTRCHYIPMSVVGPGQATASSPAPISKPFTEPALDTVGDIRGLPATDSSDTAVASQHLMAIAMKPLTMHNNAKHQLFT